MYEKYKVNWDTLYICLEMGSLSPSKRNCKKKA